MKDHNGNEMPPAQVDDLPEDVREYLAGQDAHSKRIARQEPDDDPFAWNYAEGEIEAQYQKHLADLAYEHRMEGA